MYREKLSAIVIRLAEMDDHLKLLELMLNYLDFYQVKKPKKSEIIAFITMICSNPRSGCFLVAEHHQQLIGFATLYTTYSTFQLRHALILNDIYVLPEFRRRGVASSLLKSAENFREQGHYAFLEWMTSSENDVAIKFYKKYGAKMTNWIVFNTQWKA